MRLWYLHLRSRIAGWAALALAAIGGLTGLWLAQIGQPGVAMQLLLVVMPLAGALVIGASLYSPFGELEASASYPVPVLRLGHLAGLLLLGAMALGVAARAGGTASVEGQVLRNLAGFAGLVLLSVPVLGSRLSWIAPLAYGVLAFWMGASVPERPATWAWPLQPGDDKAAMATALLLLAIGLAGAVLPGARDRRGEGE